MATTDYLSPLGSEDAEEVLPEPDELPLSEEVEEKGMSLIDHLDELRNRLIVAIISIAVAAIIGWFLEPYLEKILILPLGKHITKLFYFGVGGAFSIHLQLTFVLAVAFALPVLLYEIYAFVSPGLTTKENRYAIPFIFIGTILFACGVTIAYFVLPYPVDWLLNFSDSNLQSLLEADQYFVFVGFFLLVFGLVFELPLLLTLLAQLNIISSDFLRKKRAVALFGLWVASTFITPGADPVSPIILGVAFTILYEVSILLIRFTKH